MTRMARLGLLDALGLLGALACGALLSSAQAQSEVQPPTVQALASAWLDVDELAHMPSLHNFHDMAACAPDLVGVNLNPDGQLFDWPTGPRWFRYMTLPLVELKVNGQSPPSQTCRWYPYQAVRRWTGKNSTCQTKVRMLVERPGLLYELKLGNPTDRAQAIEVDLSLPGTLQQGAAAVVAYESDDARLGKAHTFGDTDAQPIGTDLGKLQMAHALVDEPQRTTSSDTIVSAHWAIDLAPGESRTLRWVMAHGRSQKSQDFTAVTAAAQALAANFGQEWKGVKQQWQARWLQMFTPGNGHFSGSLPTLVTDNSQLSDIYYRSLLTLLVLHRTNMQQCDRVFVTSGERQKGVVFFWDTSMWSKVFALLEPEGMKQHAKLFLACDPHRGPVYNMDLGEQWEGWYAANDSTIFLFVSEYLNVTGDLGFLDEQVGDQTVLQRLETLATNWQKLQRDKSLPLADYGENRNLLECAPAYIHRVPSFNAANVWMMRTVADWHASRGNAQRAAELRDLADEVAGAVLTMYKPGEGVWHALHRDGKRVELRHCYDFVCLGRFMSADLPPATKHEMVAFVERELITDHWMRAMSPRDQAAAISDRPDHGPMGAYDAWPALSAESMCLLGAWRPALKFFTSTQDVLYEGVYGQSREFYGPRRAERDAPVRIAMRGACMRESVGGGAFAETVLGAFFGFRPQAGQPLQLYQPNIDRGFDGQLVKLPYRGELLRIESNSQGVRVLSSQ